MKTRLLAILTLLFLLYFPVLTRAQNPAPPEIDRLVRQLMDSAGVPGLSLALIRDGKPTYSQAYGLVKSDSTQKVSRSTIFEAASLSKPVFAFAVLQLVEEGRLDLDKPLADYLPYPDVASDERYRKITARMVLSHRTGFPNWRGSRPLTVKNDPGTKFGYSGEGFVYLQKVVEKITGRPINALMTERVFKPLGMARSSYLWRADFEPDFARPHNQFGFPFTKGKPENANMAYSLQTTADDYARFLSEILNPTHLKQPTIQAMLNPETRLPVRFNRDTTLSESLFWGLGFGLEKTPAGDYFWHWGDNGTFRCFVAADRGRKNAVVYLTNSAGGLSFINELTTALIGGPHPAAGFLGYDSYRDPVGLFARRLQTGSVQEALNALTGQPGKPALDENHFFSIGNQFLEAGQFEKALEIFRYNADTHPASANARYGYGVALLLSGQREEAVRQVQKAVSMKPAVGKSTQILAGLDRLKQPAGGTRLVLKGFPDARLVTLAGSFNGWDNLHTFFEKAGGEWVCHLDLKPGTYPYKIVVDGNWITDPGNLSTEKDDQGNVNSLLTVK
ncbi:serine hydrolase [Larkinella soli]|uniref:serine hydrolase n=1 Tax=Larkinella soli TaxID=1770527 RepID=UPI000FFB713C|nr:serine hydrolase [Larkinella soli]